MMTETARDLRSAAHALEEVVTALRALSDDLNEPDPEPDPEPVWPTAPYVWHDGKVWAQAALETYFGDGNFWGRYHLNSEITAAREGARRFAREAVPVVAVPAAEWWAFRASATRRECHRTEAALIDATDALAQEVAR